MSSRKIVHSGLVSIGGLLIPVTYTKSEDGIIDCEDMQGNKFSTHRLSLVR